MASLRLPARRVFELAARRRERTHAMAEALAQGTITPRLIATLNDKVVTQFRMVELVILVIIIVLMVMKSF